MPYLSVQLDCWRMCCLNSPPVPTLAVMIKAGRLRSGDTGELILLGTVFNHLRVCVDLGLSRDVDTLGGNNNLIRFIKLAHTQSMCNIPCRCTSSFSKSSLAEEHSTRLKTYLSSAKTFTVQGRSRDQL